MHRDSKISVVYREFSLSLHTFALSLFILLRILSKGGGKGRKIKRDSSILNKNQNAKKQKN